MQTAANYSLMQTAGDVAAAVCERSSSSRKLPVLALAAFSTTSFDMQDASRLSILAAYAPFFLKPLFVAINHYNGQRKLNWNGRRAGLPYMLLLYCSGWVFPTRLPHAKYSYYRTTWCAIEALRWYEQCR